MLLEGLSDSSFSEEWSSWINSIDIDLDLDEALQPEFGLQFYQVSSPYVIDPRFKYPSLLVRLCDW
jgi:hypothetical protein